MRSGAWARLLLTLALPALCQSLVYRIAQSSDLTAIAQLRVKVFSPHLTSTYSLYQQEKQYGDAAAEKTRVLVAADPENGSIVGAADMQLHAAVVTGEAQAEAVCYVSGVCVDPDRRRLGIGRQLMAEADLAVAELRASLLALHVDADNTPAHQLYQDLGFVVAADDSALATHFADCLDPDEPPQLFMSKRVDAMAAIQAWHTTSASDVAKVAEEVRVEGEEEGPAFVMTKEEEESYWASLRELEST